MYHGFFGENNRFYKIVAIAITVVLMAFVIYALILEFGGAAAIGPNLVEFLKCLLGVGVFSVVVYLVMYTIVFFLTFHFIRYKYEDFIYSVNEIKYADGSTKYCAMVQREKFAKFEILSEDTRNVDDEERLEPRYMLAKDNLLVTICGNLDGVYFDSAHKAWEVANGYKQQIFNDVEKEKQKKAANKVIKETQLVIS